MAVLTTDPARQAELVPELDRAFTSHPDDALLGWYLATALRHANRAEEANAVLLMLTQKRPDLQFGTDLEQELRRAGRYGEVPALQQAWLLAAPDNQQALAGEIGLELDTERRDDAIRHARDLLFLHGASPQRLMMLCEVLIVAGELREATALAQRLLRGDDFERALAWLHLGQLALLQGRTSSALEAWTAGVAASRPFGNQAPIFETLEELMSLALYLHADAELEPAAKEVIGLYDRIGESSQALAWRIELDARKPATRCRGVADELARLPAGAGHGTAERLAVRAAAAAGCMPCANAVRLGLAPREPNVRSLLQLGLCAEHEGQLEMAADVLHRAERLTEFALDDGDSPSTVSAILAHYHRARVLGRLGRSDEAKDEYKAFLSRWGDVDRALPEVIAAKHALTQP
jgi:tetratricopeptide (TPR) repeat protein